MIRLFLRHNKVKSNPPGTSVGPISKSLFVLYDDLMSVSNCLEIGVDKASWISCRRIRKRGWEMVADFLVNQGDEAPFQGSRDRHSARTFF